MSSNRREPSSTGTPGLSSPTATTRHSASDPGEKERGRKGLMDVLEAIRTTRSMRRLDPARDVSDEDLVTIIDAATRAPTGGNSQPVRWLVVRDLELKRRVGEVYRAQARLRLVTYEQDAKSNPDVARMLRGARHLADHLGGAPALLIPGARAVPDPASFRRCRT